MRASLAEGVERGILEVFHAGDGGVLATSEPQPKSNKIKMREEATRCRTKALYAIGGPYNSMIMATSSQ